MADSENITAFVALGGHLSPLTVTVPVPDPDLLVSAYGERFRNARFVSFNDGVTVLVAGDVSNMGLAVHAAAHEWSETNQGVPDAGGLNHYWDETKFAVALEAIPIEVLWTHGVVPVSVHVEAEDIGFDARKTVGYAFN